jgi:hypothetical protein
MRASNPLNKETDKNSMGPSLFKLTYVKLPKTIKRAPNNAETINFIFNLVVQKKLCKPPLSGKIKMTMEVLLWQEKKKASYGK